MDIVLVNPPTLHLGATYDDLINITTDNPTVPYYRLLRGSDASINGQFSTIPGEHLGLQSLQASLEVTGHQVVVINACIEMHSSLQQTLNRIKEYDADLIGFTGPLDVFAENLWLARALRESGYTGHITFGHDFATLNHQQLLELYPEFDSIVRGEGEITICALATVLEQRLPLHTVRGLSFREQTHVIVNAPRPVVHDLDTLPWVTRYSLPVVQDLKMGTGIFTKRGCPYHCSFCTTGAVSHADGTRGHNSWRQRSARCVVDEMEFLVREYGVRWFTIVDDLYLAKGPRGAQHALEIAEELLQRHLDVSYMIDCRVDSINAEVFAVLYRSGLRKVFVGVESASSSALSFLNKGYTPEIIRSKLHILDKLHIELILGYILFNPLDTLEGLEQSHQLLLDLGVSDSSLLRTETRVYPGTNLHHNLEQRGLLQGEFPFFTAEYQDASVRKLHDLLMNFDGTCAEILAASENEVELNHALMFDLVNESLKDMIACCKRDDDHGLEAVYNRLVMELNNAV